MKPEIEIKETTLKIKDNSIAIIGWHDGAAGQIQSWLEKAGKYHVACFVNPTDKVLEIDPTKIPRDASQFSYPTSISFKERLLISASNWVERLKELHINKVLITTDDAQQRFQQIEKARKAGLQLVNAIHPTVFIAEDAILYDNIILYPKSYIGYRAEVFPGAIINTNAQIDHHNVIRECTTIDPGVTFAGNVTIGKFSRVHTAVTIKNRIRVGEHSIIGAGAVIIEDVPDNVTVVGVPGRIIKYHQAQ